MKAQRMAAAQDQMNNVQRSVPPHISYDVLRRSSSIIIGKWVVLAKQMIWKVRRGYHAQGQEFLQHSFRPYPSIEQGGSQRPPPLWEAIMTISSRNSPLFNQAVYVHGDDATRWRRPAAGLQHPYPDDGPHMTCKSQKWPLWDAPINSTSFPPPITIILWVKGLTQGCYEMSVDK